MRLSTAPLAFLRAILVLATMLPCAVFAGETNQSEDKKPVAKFTKKKDFEDRLMDEIPYAKELKPIWKFVDGDVDVMGIDNLRADRRNKGLIYTTNYIPFVGETKEIEFKLRGGDDFSLSFQTSHIPFAGELKGFKMHGKVGSDDSKIVAQYKIPLDF